MSKETDVQMTGEQAKKLFTQRQEDTRARELESGEWIKFTELGDSVIGRVIEFFMVKGDRPNVKMEAPDSSLFIVGLSKHLQQLIDGSKVGHVLEIMLIDRVPIPGQPEPMKEFGVLDHGSEFPNA